MAKCEICGKTVKTTFQCDDCGCRFCDACGNTKRLLCQDCINYEEETHGGYKPEQQIEIDVEDTD